MRDPGLKARLWRIWRLTTQVPLFRKELLPISVLERGDEVKGTGEKKTNSQ